MVQRGLPNRLLHSSSGWAFFESTFPVISRYYQDARERLPRLLNSSLQVTALLVIPMAAGGTVLARPMLTSLYGAQYGAAAVAFQFLIWGVAIELLGMNWGYALMACDSAKEYMKAVGLGAILSVILNLALIPKFGLMGAGLTRLACSAIISLYFGFQFRRNLPSQVGATFVEACPGERIDGGGNGFSGPCLDSPDDPGWLGLCLHNPGYRPVGPRRGTKDSECDLGSVCDKPPSCKQRGEGTSSDQGDSPN